MTSETATTERGQRRFSRAPLSGEVRYQYGTDDVGRGRWHDVGRGGARLILGRYLRPGRHLLLSSTAADRTIELKARVVWCRPATGRPEFEAGVRVFQDTLDADHQLWTLMSEPPAATRDSETPEPDERPSGRRWDNAWRMSKVRASAASMYLSAAE